MVLLLLKNSRILSLFSIQCLYCYYYSQHQACAIQPARIPSVLAGGLSSETCFLQRNSGSKLKAEIRQVVMDTLDLLVESSSSLRCGDEGWTRVAFLNMSDPNEACPSNLTLITTPIRSCGRTNRARFSIDSVFFAPSVSSYSEVCGRIIAYQRGDTAAFVYSLGNWNQNSIEGAYVDGVSLSYGPTGSRQHIWTFASSQSENSSRIEANCPCTHSGRTWSHSLPSFIRNDYFCDTGNYGAVQMFDTFYSSDPLWDGEGCGSFSTCCQFNSPPWFQRQLPASTSDDIELRLIQGDPYSHQDVAIHLVEIYVK